VLLDIIESVSTPQRFYLLHEQLNQEEQTRIINIVNDEPKAAPQAIADELVSCGSKIELQTIKVSMATWLYGVRGSYCPNTSAIASLPSARITINRETHQPRD